MNVAVSRTFSWLATGREALSSILNTIPSISEETATGEVAKIYRDIRETLRVPVTNLIWRCLAAIDGALPFVWQTVKPLYFDDTVRTAAAALRDINHLPQLPKWSDAALRTVDINESNIQIARAVLANYDTTNPLNLIVLNALLAGLEGQPARREITRSQINIPPKAIAVDLPRLVPVSEMSITTRRAAITLNGIGLRRPPTDVIAGVPRHLANWPRFLELSVATLRPFSQEIGRSITVVQQQAAVDGAALNPGLARCAKPANSGAIVLLLRKFSSVELIANYIPKVRMLHLALQHDATR